MININPTRALRNLRGRTDGRRRNPCGCGGSPSTENPGALGWVGIIGATALALGGGYWLYNELMHPPGQTPLPPGPEPGEDPATALAGIVLPGATLAEAPAVVADVQQPISLTTIPIVGSIPSSALRVTDLAVATSSEGVLGVKAARFGTVQPNGITMMGQLTAYNANGQVLFNSTAESNVDKAIAAVVTNVTGDFAHFVYESWLGEIVQRGSYDLWGIRDEVIRDVLETAAPAVDWSQGLAPYAYGDLPSTVWNATQTIGAIAVQSAINKGILG